MRGPVRAEITTEGIDCVTDWSGDVARFLHDKRGYGPTTNYHGPVFNAKADGNQFAWQNRDVTQITGHGLSAQDQQDVRTSPMRSPGRSSRTSRTPAGSAALAPQSADSYGPL
ncbi:hypothetical protein [Dactylosporangium sp. NPDC051541]|uniref:hypothetical protein n=1 Tax=Dactylosporangium sp. NPDC051541 TaxID=3363977 RepID=UPI0037B9BCF4